MTRFYFVRHAESEMNVIASEVVGGRSNHARLTQKGERQAQLFGEYILRRGFHFDGHYASPAIRTQHTLSIALDAAGIDNTISTIDAIQELSQGAAEGMERSTVWTEEVVKRLRQDPLNFAMDGGESFNNVADRMTSWMKLMAEKHPKANLLVAGHGLAIRCAAGRYHNWSHETIMKTSTPNVSLSLFEVTDRSEDVRFVGKRVVSTDAA